MATTTVNCTRNSIESALNGSTSTWTTTSYIRSGVLNNDYNYRRTRVKFTTGDFPTNANASAKKFIVKIKLSESEGSQYPSYCHAILTTKSVAPNKVMADNLIGAHADLTAGSIGESYSYASDASTASNNRVPTGAQATGYTFYFSFSSTNIQPNTAYYVYIYYYYSSTSLGSSSGWTYALSGNVSAYVKVNTYTLTLNKNDSNVASFVCDNTGLSSATVMDGASVNTTATAATGYYLSKFTGTAAKGYTQTEWISEGKPQSRSTPWTMCIDRTITAYASPRTYEVTFDPNEGTNVTTGKFASGNILTFTYNSTNNNNLSSEIPTKDESHQFTGWWTAPAGGVKVYDDTGNAVANTDYWSASKKWIKPASITLYAQWKLKTYLIVFDANGGTDEPDPISKIHGTSVILPEGSYKGATAKSITTTFNYNYTGAPAALTSESLVTTTYTFDNWNTQPDGYGMNYSAGSTYTEDKDTILFASYYPSTPVGAIVTLPNVSRVGYTFLGWSRTPSGNIIEGYYRPVSNTTLYAKWQVNSYKVFLMDNDSIIDTFSVQYDQTIQLPDFSESALSEASCTSNVMLTGSALDNQGSTIQLNIPISVTKELQHTFYQGYDADEQLISPWNTTSYHHIYAHNVSIKRGYTETGSYYLSFKMPNQNTYPQAYKQLVNWQCDASSTILPSTVTPGSTVKLRSSYNPSGYLGSYTAQYVPSAGMRVFLNQNNNYKIGTPFIKVNGTFVRGDAYFVKAGGRWMTLLEYLNTYN